MLWYWDTSLNKFLTTQKACSSLRQFQIFGGQATHTLHTPSCYKLHSCCTFNGGACKTLCCVIEVAHGARTLYPPPTTDQLELLKKKFGHSQFKKYAVKVRFTLHCTFHSVTCVCTGICTTHCTSLYMHHTLHIPVTCICTTHCTSLLHVYAPHTVHPCYMYMHHTLYIPVYAPHPVTPKYC
jgi:hypothetical protein